MRLHSLPLRVVAFLALAVVAITCTDAPTGPSESAKLSARHLLMAPSFSAEAARVYGNLAAFGVEVTEVHIHLTGPDGVARDTVIAFPVGQDQITVDIPVPAGNSDAPFTAFVELRNDQHTVLFSGTQSVVARTSTTGGAPATPITINYSGPGHGTRTVTLRPGDTTVSATSAVPYSATAIDSSNAVVSNLLVRYTVSDATLASVTQTADATATITGLNKRGTATVTATTPQGVFGTARITFAPAASRIVVVSGGGQTGVAGSVLTQPLVVEVQASDNLPVAAGVPVTFRAVTSGGAVTTASANTDATGRASTQLTLGRTAGSYTFEAASGSVTPVTVSATATAAPAATIAKLSGDLQADSIGRPLALPLVVKVTDQFGAAVSGAAVSFVKLAGSGTVGSATANTASDGTASTSYTLGNVVGTDSIRASVAGSTTSVIFTARAGSRGAAVIQIVSGGGQSGVPTSTLPAPVVVRVIDQIGNVLPNVPVNFTITGTGASVNPAIAVTNSSGQAQTTVTLGTTAGPTTITATSGSASITATATVVAGSASNLTKTAGDNQTATVNTNVAVAPSVTLKDANGNPVPNASITFAVASGGGSITGAAATTNASGIATVGSWKLGTTAGPNTLNATTGSFNVTFSATGTADVAAQLSIATQPSPNATSGVAFATQPVVRLVDVNNNNVSQSGVVVTAAIASGGGTLNGTASATTDAAGIATFTNLGITGTVGARTLQFTAPSLTAVTSSSVSVAVGAPANVTKIAGDNQSTVAGTSVSIAPQVKVTDASNNPVPGVTVTFTVASGGGSVTGATPVTDANGLASVSSWSLGTTAGANTLSATVGSISQTFSATATAGSASRILAVSGVPSQITVGQPYAAPIVVRIADANGNTVAQAGVPITGTVTLLPSTVQASGTIATDASGQATLSPPPYDGSTGNVQISASSPGFVTYTSPSIPAVAGAAAKVRIVTQPSNVVSGQAFPTQPVLQVVDVGNNAVNASGVTVSAHVVNAGGSVGGTTSATSNGSGVAAFTGLTFSGVNGPHGLAFNSSLSATDSATSAVFTSTSGAASRLTIVTQPSGTAASGAVFAQQPVVQLVDASGNSVAQSGSSVNAAILSGGGTLNGTTPVLTDGAGRATFTNLSITGTTGGRTLQFSTGTLGTATSNGINITVGAAAKFVPSSIPTLISVGQAIPATVLQVADASNQPVAQAGINVNATFAVNGGGSVAASGTTNTSGSVTLNFPTYSGSRGAGTALITTSSSLATFTSNTITVNAGAAAALTVTGQPSNVASGQAFSTQPTLQVVDVGNNAVSTNTVTVSAHVVSNGGTLSGTTSATSNNGVVTFTNLIFSGVNGPHALAFNSNLSGTDSVTSNVFTSTSGTANRLLMFTQPSSTASSGTVFAQQPVIQIADASGNAVTQSGTAVTVAIASGGGTLNGTSVATTDGAGKATFTNLSITGSTGLRTLQFVASGLTGVTSGSINITVGAAAKLTSTSVPSAISVGTTIPTVVLQVADASNQPVSQAGINVNATLSVSGGTSVTTSGTSNSSGVVNLNFPNYNGSVGSGTALITTSSSLATYTSSSINVNPGPGTTIVIVTQPSTTTQAGQPLPTQPVVKLVDAGGNTLTPGSVGTINIIATIASGGGSVTGGSNVLTNSNGVATYSTLGIGGTVGAHTLQFSGSGLTGVTSNSVNVTTGIASAVVASAGGSTQTATVNTNVPIAPAVTVTDAYGNPVSGVVVTFHANNGGIAQSADSARTDVAVTTNASGVAALVSWKLGSATGAQTLTGTTSVGVVTFNANATAPTLQTIAGAQLASYPHQTIAAGSVQFRLLDASSNPIPGATVTVSGSRADCSFNQSPLTTNASGIASLPAIALDSNATGCVIYATTSGVAQPAYSQVVTHPYSATHVWFGTLGSNFETAGNWRRISDNANAVPTSASDQPYIPQWNIASGPVAHNAKTFAGIIVGLAGIFDLNGYSLLSTGSVQSPGGSFTNGTVTTQGVNLTAQGDFANFTSGSGSCSMGGGQATYISASNVSGTLNAHCATQIDGTVVTNAFTSESTAEITVNGIVTTAAAAMNGSRFRVNPEATMNVNGNSQIAGLLDLAQSGTINVTGNALFNGYADQRSTEGQAGNIFVTGNISFGGAGSAGYYFNGGNMALDGNFSTLPGGTGPAFIASYPHILTFNGEGANHTFYFNDSVNEHFGDIQVNDGTLTSASSATFYPYAFVDLYNSNLTLRAGDTIDLSSGPIYFTNSTATINGGLSLYSCQSDHYPMSPFNGTGLVNGATPSTTICPSGGEVSGRGAPASSRRGAPAARRNPASVRGVPLRAGTAAEAPIGKP